jgi:large subunit ribosomal protein L21e
MVERSKGSRSKTRHKLSKSIRERGMPRIWRVTQKFKPGDLVHIKLDPSVHRGMPHPRFHGHTGVVSSIRGRAYLVKISDGGKEKTIIVSPEHMLPQR